MIQANELRRGNKVLFSDDGTIFTVDGISEKGLDVSNEVEKTWIEIDQFEPIKLTEEILMKCGFKYEKEKIYWQNPNMAMPYVITANFGIFMSCSLTTYKKDWLLAKFNTLHQLQNLYFALTNEDLQINL